jgi:tetratricopeptide (TPR) repeat protein
MLGFVHVEHSSMYQRNEEVWKHFPEQQIADYGREDGVIGYAWMARYTLHFLDAYLKHDPAALGWLKKTPAENGAPQHMLAVNYRPAKGFAPSLDSFRAELGRRGFDQAESTYAAMQKESPAFKLDQNAVNTWGYELMSGGHLTEAIDILNLNAKTYPDSGDVFDSLAEAYMRSGQKQRAIDNYKRSLEKDPSNDNARQKLKELGEHPSEQK